MFFDDVRKEGGKAYLREHPYNTIIKGDSHGVRIRHWE